MNAQAFWNVIGNYNKQTWAIQILLMILLLFSIALSYMQKVKWAAKFSLGIANLFIGVVFFCMVWNRTNSKILCPAIISVLRYLVFI